MSDKRYVLVKKTRWNGQPVNKQSFVGSSDDAYSVARRTIYTDKAAAEEAAQQCEKVNPVGFVVVEYSDDAAH